MSLSQIAACAMMIRPAAFGFNPEAAASNAMQKPMQADAQLVQLRAAQEFDAAVAALSGAGVRLSVQPDSVEPVKPDAIFPNNWISLHADGTLVLYPMQSAARRPERRREVIDAVIDETGFQVTRMLDLSRHEQSGEFLEGTGSLVLDHPRRTAYACRSARTSEALVERWCSLMGYEPVVFDATDKAGRPYYHTNVMLSIGSDWVVVAMEAIDSRDRDDVMRALEISGRTVQRVDRGAVDRFACNILELTGLNANGERQSVLAMSAAANAALQEARVAPALCAGKTPLAVPIPTIEHCGGGSIRCMIAEVFAAL